MNLNNNNISVELREINSIRPYERNPRLMEKILIFMMIYIDMSGSLWHISILEIFPAHISTISATCKKLKKLWTRNQENDLTPITIRCYIAKSNGSKSKFNETITKR
jgi:hypothetical protein